MTQHRTSDIKSAKLSLKMLKDFENISGLKVNIEKNEGFLLGTLQNKSSDPGYDLGLQWSNKPIKIIRSILWL